MWGRRLVLLIILAAIVVAAYFGYQSYVVAPQQSAQAPAPAQPVPAPKVAPPPPTTRPQERPRTEATARPPRRRRATPAPAAPVPPPAPTQTMLTIASDVDGALVFIDRKYIGKTPLPPQAVEPGSHRLNVSADGYDPYGQTVDLQPGDQTITVQFKVVRLNERVAVKHKHTFGSCEGTLIATVDGIQYQTTHKDDAFRAPLADMTTFKVDYLKNTLTIALRGHTYNFTEQQGGPDALLVFQQHVQKAIEQLKKSSGG